MTERALVLGGGGITGIAWELGVIAGLAELGVDLTGADVVVGTSAGSVVGAQIATGVDVEERYQAQLAPPTGEIAASIGPATMLRLGLAMIGPPSPQRIRARIGRMAARTASTPESDRIAVIGARLPKHEWPDRALRITAVDARTGAFTVFDRTSDVPLVSAVAASCAVPGVWPPVTIGAHRYIDGGVRSPANVDLARDCDRVVVLAPIARGMGGGTAVAAQARRLRGRVAVVTPDAAAVTAIGRNVLDPARRAAAARAGRAQAKAALAQVQAVWEE
ncbi:patatin-like phospholipase family protein [Pseudonocardia sp. GCM10023141]|uniref:patatin-like phospholipase family protein n=1 Tax=Pseudonocardia sp. GCM10023141 TaxID=3252653 RepID=UPI0036146694